MKTSNRVLSYLLIALPAVVFLSQGCNKRQEPSASRTPKSQIATVKEFTSPVRFRRSEELVWSEVKGEIPLYQYDAIQTHSKASARLALKNRSEIELGPDSLVILDPSALDLGAGRDRAVLRGGTIKGSTKNELWILTSAALIQMKPKSKNKLAKAVVSIQMGKKLQIQLKEGTGKVFHRQSEGMVVEGEGGSKNVRNLTGYRQMNLRPGVPVELPAPVLPESLGQDGTETALYNSIINNPSNSSGFRDLAEDAKAGLTKEQLATVIREHQGDIRKCYESALSRNPGMEAKIIVSFTILGTGKVGKATAKERTGDEKLDRCILANLNQWKFPKPGRGVEVAVSYPFVLKSLGM